MVAHLTLLPATRAVRAEVTPWPFVSASRAWCFSPRAGVTRQSHPLQRMWRARMATPAGRLRTSAGWPRRMLQRPRLPTTRSTRRRIVWAKPYFSVDNITDLAVCATRTYGGFTDWRLPTASTLRNLADRENTGSGNATLGLSAAVPRWGGWTSTPAWIETLHVNGQCCAWSNATTVGSSIARPTAKMVRRQQPRIRVARSASASRAPRSLANNRAEAQAVCANSPFGRPE